MTWQPYPENKPENDASCVVKNSKGFMHQQLAIYYAGDDLFIMYDPHTTNHPPLNVTHYIEIPGR